MRHWLVLWWHSVKLNPGLQSTTIEPWLPIPGNFLLQFFGNRQSNQQMVKSKFLDRHSKEIIRSGVVVYIETEIFPCYFQWQTFGQIVTSSLTLPPLGCLGSNQLPFYQSLQQIQSSQCNVEPLKGDITSKTMLKCFILSENKNNMLNIVYEFLASDKKTYLTRLKSGKLKRF